PVRRKTVGDDAEGEARRLLDRLGLSDPGLLNRRVSDLSVGQQQRVAAARALIGGPDIVIADEPTSALDSDARDRFIELLSEEAARTGAALLFVSHDRSLASHFSRAVDLGEINHAQVAA
ncbi:MAG: ATP-binding cassette domain-containing protein, partial [Hyphomonas sp.]|nr:ATP-binding cassette domain-containing protein [Hyphomonas sp.]